MEGGKAAVDGAEDVSDGTGGAAEDGDDILSHTPNRLYIFTAIKLTSNP